MPRRRQAIYIPDHCPKENVHRSFEHMPQSFQDRYDQLYRGLCKCINEEIENERALNLIKAAERRLEAVISQHTPGYFTVDAAALILLTTSQLEALYEYGFEEMMFIRGIIDEVKDTLYNMQLEAWGSLPQGAHPR